MIIFVAWRLFLHLKAYFLLQWTPGSFGNLRFLCNIVVHYRLLNTVVVFSSYYFCFFFVVVFFFVCLFVVVVVFVVVGGGWGGVHGDLFCI